MLPRPVIVARCIKTSRETRYSGQTIILDGGTGTDIQRRGVPMSGETWCADANLTHPGTVRAVHEDYIAAGADIIIANTFATSALLFNNLKRDDDLLEIDRVAVKIAQTAVAAQKKQVAVAGSMSTMRPMVTGSDRNNLDCVVARGGGAPSVPAKSGEYGQDRG